MTTPPPAELPVQRSGIACAGAWIVDKVYQADHWPVEGELARVSRPATGVGGGAANVVTDLHTLRAPFALAAVGCVGDDDEGRLIQAHCAALGLRDVHLAVLPQVSTSVSLVMGVPGRSRTFFYHGGANDACTIEHVPVQALARAGYRILYFGYLLVHEQLDRLDADGLTGAARMLREARAAGLRTCVDCASDARPDFARIVAAALPHCDHLVVNEVEGGRAAGITVRHADGRLDDAALRRAAQRLLELGVQRDVVVHAPEGALWCTADGACTWQPASCVAAHDIVSTVGAGDAFCAAVLYGLHEGWPAQHTMQAAHCVAAACLRGATATDGLAPMNALLAGLPAPPRSPAPLLPEPPA